MKRTLKIRDGALRPYQTHFLFQAQTPLTLKGVDHLVRDLLFELNDGVTEAKDQCVLLQRSKARKEAEEILSWVVYRKAPVVRWAAGPGAPRDTEHHLAVLIARDTLLTLVATEKPLGPKLARSTRESSGWSALRPAPPETLEAALVHGHSRTLWLSGIHRSVAAKADSKMLVGCDVEATLDALGDQTYQYTSTRCAGPADSFPRTSVGVTPRSAKVWLGPSPDWTTFRTNSRELLRLVGARPESGTTPYPLLARSGASLAEVHDAFDVSFTPPEYLYDEDPTVLQHLAVLEGARWSVRPIHGADCVVTLHLDSGDHDIQIQLRSDRRRIVASVNTIDPIPAKEVVSILALCRRPDLLKIFYESLHTYSDGALFEVRTRPFVFDVSPRDFSGYDITLEKPKGPGGPGACDLSRIGVSGEPSLFSWVWKTYRDGWLWCDDGSGEIADFIHLAPDKTLSLIHVKAAHTASAARGISVSAYEVVCSQALKNLRYTERVLLEGPLKEKLAETHLARGWHNGEPLALQSPSFLKALESVRYSELRRRVVILQPHVRKALLPSDLSADTRAVHQALLLYTLLYSVKADVNRYGVDFEVIVDR